MPTMCHPLARTLPLLLLGIALVLLSGCGASAAPNLEPAVTLELSDDDRATNETDVRIVHFWGGEATERTSWTELLAALRGRAFADGICHAWFIRGRIHISGKRPARDRIPVLLRHTRTFRRGFEGVWDTNYNRMVLDQNGRSVRGHYDWDDGRIRGTVSTDGMRLNGTWHENGGPEDMGPYEFVLDPDGMGFTGWWTHDNGDRQKGWSGTRVS